MVMHANAGGRIIPGDYFMLDRKWGKQEVLADKNFGEFSLKNWIDSNKASMTIPSRKINVLIIDESPRDIEGMEPIIRAWPNVKLMIILGGEMTGVEIAPLSQMDVVLVNERMPGLVDGDVGRLLKLVGFKGVAASISEGIFKPDFAKHQFNAKSIIEKEELIAENFVKFMNGIIQEIG